MVNPVPGKSISTVYGKRGSSWSCDKNSSGGVHTGADFAAPSGTKVVAARPGKVRHVNYGSAFGTKQVAITGPDGTEDFYAHMRTRVASGTSVKAGDKIGEVGSEGNTTGPHLHFERHRSPGSWTCSNHVNPQPSIDWKDDSVNPGKGKVYLSKLKYGQRDSDSVARLQQALNAHSMPGGKNMPVTGNYLDMTDDEVRLCQSLHLPPADKKGKSFVGEKQAAHLFAGTGHEVVNDLTPPPDPDPPPAQPDPGARIVYWYSGKPSTPQSLGTGYSTITSSRFVAPKQDGWLMSMLYANVGHSLKASDTGGIRFKMVRENPIDATAYDDRAVLPTGIESKRWLSTALWFGSWKSGRPLHWEARRSKSLGTSEIGTRYTKVLYVGKGAPLLLAMPWRWPRLWAMWSQWRDPGEPDAPVVIEA
jgi:hypothetical protein